MINLSKIKLNPNNPRLIKDEKFKKLCDNVSQNTKFLEFRPIVIESWDNPIILGGNMRYKALIHLGYKEVPETYIKVAKDFSEDERKAFTIVDNNNFGEWDWDQLANEWDIGDLDNWGVDVPNMLPESLDAEDDNYEIPDQVKTDIVIGDYFEIGPHRLLCGDSTQTDTFKALFGDDMADLVVTDPPYNVAYEGKTKNKLTIDNDKQTDGDFYKFLLDFYTALGSYTKPGGGMVCMACRF